MGFMDRLHAEQQKVTGQSGSIGAPHEAEQQKAPVQSDGSWLSRLHDEQQRVVERSDDPWLTRLEKVRGDVDFVDGQERITSLKIMDLLGIPQRCRRANTYRRVSKLMTELGWTAIRIRGKTRGDYLERVRGYSRPAKPRPGPRPRSIEPANPA